jgi:kynurenine 3-monooxygenase
MPDQINNDHILIVGGGPAGLGAALAFHNNNYRNITVLEGRSDFNFDLENSYPIGLNLRGKNAINNLIGKNLGLDSFGLQVDQWKIIVGPGINVASFNSGLTHGTSRAGVTLLLYEEVKQRKEIKVLFGHKAKAVELETKTLTCETNSGELKKFTSDCLIICDGFRSKVRDQLAQQEKSLKIVQWPWNISFRVLISDPNPKTDLDGSIHYIVNSNYMAKFTDGRWTCVMGIRNDAPSFLSSKDPSDENVEQLKKYLQKRTPQALNLFSDDEYRKYFSRNIFQGAVTKVSKILINDWALLLGDAAHSTIPATGEGINSALEDCLILDNTLKSYENLEKALINFEKNRLEDVHALSDMAYGAVNSGLKEVFQNILLAPFKKINLVGPSKEDLMFGRDSASLKRYSEILKSWKQQTMLIGGPTVPKIKF